MLAVGLLAACSGDGGPFDMGWGLECSSNRFAAIALEPAESAGHGTPEMAVDRFLNPERPEGLSTELPGESLPKEGWERADFVPTATGTAPVTATVILDDESLPLPQLAFVHRNRERIDGVLVMRAGPYGWNVDSVHACAD